MATVNYPEFRDYKRLWTETNDTVMGLLVGSKLAAKSLTLTAGSHLQISQIFPDIPHVRRFDLSSSRAREILDDSEHLLCILAVPQILAIHEDLIKSIAILINHNSEAGAPIIPIDGLKTANMHERISTTHGVEFTSTTLELFHLIRVARNSHVHSGGVASQTLHNRRRETSEEATVAWEQITRTQLPHYTPGKPVPMGLSELISILAITKKLADEANSIASKLVTREAWSDIVLQDMEDQSRKPLNTGQAKRKIKGFARTYYSTLGLTSDELEAAVDRRM